MTSTALGKELQTYLPNLAQAPELYRPMLAHQYAELVRLTEDRLLNFMPGTPEQARVKAEMQAAAQYMLNQALIQDRPAEQVEAALEVGPGWQLVGMALGQLVGCLVRGAVELVLGLVVGALRAIFAAPKPKIKRNEVDDWTPTVCGPVRDVRNNVHVRVEVDVKTN